MHAKYNRREKQLLQNDSDVSIVSGEMCQSSCSFHYGIPHRCKHSKAGSVFCLYTRSEAFNLAGPVWRKRGNDLFQGNSLTVDFKDIFAHELQYVLSSTGSHGEDVRRSDSSAHAHPTFCAYSLSLLFQTLRPSI